MQTLKINAKFARYFSPLEPDQKKRLEVSLKDDPTTEPIIYWTQTDEILDGHNRYEIAQRLGIELQTHGKDFDSEDAALLWIIRNQTIKRNLPDMRQAWRDAIALEIKLEGKTKTEAVESVAQTAGVSETTIWRAEAEPKEIIAKFKQTKAEFERAVVKKKQDALADLQKRARAEGLDEGQIADAWQVIETDLQSEIEDLPEFVEVQEQGETVQELIAEAPHLKRELSDKKGTKKSVLARRERTGKLKKAAFAISQTLNALDGIADIIQVTQALIELRSIADAIKAEQDADTKAAKKRKFGGK